MNATRHASHRRDHHHADDRPCSPHEVEVIDLGTSAFAVCHCCGYESPTGRHHDATAAAAEHRASHAGARPA